jgi:hypothetical protein
VTCPGPPGCSSLSLRSYSDYKTLEGKTLTIKYPPISITFGQEPILLEK